MALPPSIHSGPRATVTNPEIKTMKNKMFPIRNAVIAALICAPLVSVAAEKKASSPAALASPAASAAASPAKSSARAIPFHGMVSAVDHKANTFTIAGKESSRVFKVTNKTAITKAAQPAKMADITENIEVRGSYWKAADGGLEAKTVKVGPMGTGEEATDKTKKTAASPSPSPKKP
jgi:hypothetical protein